jgi:hypothetical protein
MLPIGEPDSSVTDTRIDDETFCANTDVEHISAAATRSANLQ